MKYLKLRLLLVFLSFSIYGNSQTALTGTLNNYIGTIIDNLPTSSGDDYVAPTVSELTSWDAMVTNILNGNYATAATQADALNYILYDFTDNTDGGAQTFYLLEEKSTNAKYWGTYVFNPAPCRSDLVIQSPHPKADFNTGKEGIYVYHKLDALAYCLSGTHRCNHSTYSSCSGTTSICGTSESYRISDMAHVTDAIFQQTSETILSVVNSAVFVQLHGFGKKSTDPYVIMSNGTRVTPTNDYISTIATELYNADNDLTFKIGHIDLSWTRLLGFTNTQGRMINNSTDDCSSNATTSLGQFIHIEQEKTKLRDNSTGWDKMYAALSTTFVCAVVPVELMAFEAELSRDKVHLSWEVASSFNNDFYTIEKSVDGKSFEVLGVIEDMPNVFLYHFYDKVGQEEIAYYRLKQTDEDGSFSYSDIVVVNLEGGKDILSMTPNIVQNITRFQVKVADIENYEMSIYNALGVETKQLEIQENFKIDLTDLNKGWYFLVLKSKNGVIIAVQKFIKI